MNYYFNNEDCLIKIEGEKTAQLLQNILTSDVSKLLDNNWQFSTLCSHQGRVLVLMRLIKINTGLFFIQFSKTLKETISLELQKYAQFSAVKLSDISDQYQQIIFLGQKTNKNTYNFNNQNNKFNIQISLIDKDKTTALKQQLANLKQLNKSQFCDQLIKLNIAHIEAKTSGLFVAQMIDLENLGGLSFDKGCYIGQEVIARLHYKGRLSKKIKTIKITDDLIQQNPKLEIGLQIKTDNTDNNNTVLLQFGEHFAQIVSRIK